MIRLGEELLRGDLVELKTPAEIIQTLDADGAVDALPFMPEMLEYFGTRFRVAACALTTCCHAVGSPPAHRFRVDDVVILEGVRCSGSAHDGCQKACMIFWRKAWLRKVEKAVVRQPHELDRN